MPVRTKRSLRVTLLSRPERFLMRRPCYGRPRQPRHACDHKCHDCEYTHPSRRNVSSPPPGHRHPVHIPSSRASRLTPASVWSPIADADGHGRAAASLHSLIGRMDSPASGSASNGPCQTRAIRAARGRRSSTGRSVFPLLTQTDPVARDSSVGKRVAVHPTIRSHFGTYWMHSHFGIGTSPDGPP